MNENLKLTPAIIDVRGMGTACEFHGVTSTPHFHDARTFGVAQHAAPRLSKQPSYLSVLVKILSFVVHLFENIPVAPEPFIKLLFLKYKAKLRQGGGGSMSWSCKLKRIGNIINRAKRLQPTR